MILVLRCDSVTSDGDSIFTPLARWENNRWTEIKIPEHLFNVPEEYHPLEYRKNILCSQKYEVHSLVLAKIDNENSCQIQQPFCGLVKRYLEKNNLPKEVSIRGNYYKWNGKKIYFYSEPENLTVGPYLLKKKEDGWIAYAEIKEKIFLDYYKYEDVIASEYYFDEDENLGFHFVPNEIENQELIIISDMKLFEYILSKLSGSIEISDACEKIKVFTNQSRALSTLFGDSFNWSIDEIKDRFLKILTDDMMRKGELLQKVLQGLKEHHVIKDEIEKYKQAEWSKEENKKRQELEVKNQYLSEEMEQKLEEEKRELKKISEKEIARIKKKVKNKQEILKNLKECSDKKRKELHEYIKKGEKWRNALYPSSNYDFHSDKNENFTLLEWDDEIQIIDRYSDFEDTDNNSRINQAISQLSRKRIYHIGGLEDLEKTESFFEAIGHKKGRFILNADASWLTPKSLWQTKGYLSGHDKLITLTDLFKIAEKNEMFVFQVEILGADRAPIEGYFGPLIKAIERKESVVAQDVLINIPDNVFFFLQLDQDEYTAKPSEWLKNKLNSIQLPSVRDENIAIPFNVMLGKDE